MKSFLLMATVHYDETRANAADVADEIERVLRPALDTPGVLDTLRVSAIEPFYTAEPRYALYHEITDELMLASYGLMTHEATAVEAVAEASERLRPFLRIVTLFGIPE